MIAVSDTQAQRPLRLYADGLLSKYGFGDGDVLRDWWWDTYDEEPPFDTHEALYRLVAELIVPLIREHGDEVEVYRIHTIHNPVRASSVNGEPVADSEMWPDLFVEIYAPQIKALAR